MKEIIVHSEDELKVILLDNVSHQQKDWEEAGHKYHIDNYFGIREDGVLVRVMNCYKDGEVTRFVADDNFDFWGNTYSEIDSNAMLVYANDLVSRKGFISVKE